jgi:hypothetical protein
MLKNPSSHCQATNYGNKKIINDLVQLFDMAPRYILNAFYWCPLGGKEGKKTPTPTLRHPV